jgi:CubicO group peptidase (beta-lactamase class C family)
MQTKPDISSVFKPIDEAIGTIMKSFELPGLAVGIVKRDETAYAKGFGVRNIATREPVTPSSLFHLASISKTFVCTAIMQLIEKGKMSLSAPVISYLPYFKLDDDRYTSITIQQMLSHLSGMPDVDGYDWDKPEYDDGALERYVRRLGHEKLIAAPGEQFAYSNMAYEVLGDVIAKVSGQTFEDCIEENILQPLAMENSTFLKQKVSADLGTTPHLKLPQTEVSPIYPYHRAHAPSSTLHSNVLEMSHWMIAHLNHGKYMDREILRPASYELLWHPYRQTRANEPDRFVGLSWFLGKYRGYRTISHAGGDIGFNTYHVLLPEQSLGVVVLANTIPTPVEEITHVILDLILGFEPQLPKPPVIAPLFRALEEKGQDAAIALYHELQHSQSGVYDFNPEYFADVGYLLMEMGRNSQALKILNLGTAIYPNMDALYVVLAQVNVKNGDRKWALENIQQCLKLNPENRWAKKLLNDLKEEKPQI